MIKPLVVAFVRLLAGAMLVLGGLASIVGSGGGGGGGGPEARLEIVSQPQDQSVFEGRSATFTVGANNATRYRWQFSVSGGAAWSDVEGATGPSVTVVASAGDDGRQVRVVVEGAGGSTATSRAATLTVLAAAGVATQPQDSTVASGRDALFSVVATGATPAYRWQISSDGGASWVDAAGGTTATLALSAVTRADDGKQVRVIVSNGGGSATSRAATLAVYEPVTLLAQPASQSVVDGSTASFSVVAANATAYQWQRFEGGSWVDVAGATGASYAFTAALAQSGLQLRVVASGSGTGNSTVSNAATLTVTSAVVPVAISADPASLTVGTGASASFSVVATGTAPAYRWQSSANGGASWTDIAGATAATYVIGAAASGDNGRQFRVVVSNSAPSSATSRAATLTVVPPVAIVTPPASQSVTEGGTATFSVTASNASTYQWQRLVGATWSDIGGATAASYAFTASLSQSGSQYRVVASNAAGSATSAAAVLTVTAAVVPVAITTQPQNATVIEGASASFAVVASGTSPAYRWQVSSNGGASWADVGSGTTASLLVPAVTLADDGKQYRVIVSNSAPSSVTSNAATLGVLAEFIVASGGAACGAGGCGGDSADGSGVGTGDGGSASAGPGLSAMRNVTVTVTKPDGKVLGSAALGADYLVSLYPRAYTGPFIVEFADNGSGRGEYFDESLRQWLPLGGQTLHVMVPSLGHHISANPMTEAAYQLALRRAGSAAGLTASAMQSANAEMLAQLNARLPSGYQTTDITNYVVPISDLSGNGTLTDTWAGRYGAVMAALPIAGSLFDSTLATPAIAFTRQLVQDMRDDSLFNASATVTGPAYDATVSSQLSAGLCTAVSIWGSPTLPSQLAPQGAGTARPGQLTLLAGTIGGAGNCDGWGRNARFDNPWRVAVDRNGYVYVADRFNYTVRKISPAGAVQTLAGSPGKQGTADGTGLAARLYSPHSIAVDGSGNVWLGDGSAIRRITPLGVVSTVAGSITQAGYADGTGSAARFLGPEDLSVDGSGNVFVADTGYDPVTSMSAAVRKVTPAGVVSTVATDCGSIGMSYIAGVAVDSLDNVYVANTGNNAICKLTPSGAASVLIPDGSGLQEPRGLAVDGSGNVYVADAFNEVVRKIRQSPGVSMSTLAGGLVQRGFVDAVGGSARFRRPNGVAVDTSGNVYVADEENHAIRKITPGGTVSTLAGLGPDFGYVDGTGAVARFFGPMASVADRSGNLYVLDAYNFVIRKITPAGVVSTLAGMPGERGDLDGTGSEARFRFQGAGDDTRTDRSPMGMAIDGGGNLYVTDRDNDSLRRITPAGVVSTVATALGFPESVAVDPSGNIYVSVSAGIRRIAAGGGGVTLFTGATRGALATDSAGNVYVAETTNGVIRKVTPGGALSTLAGTAGQRGTSDGTGAAARFSAPVSIATDAADNLYVGEVGGFNVYASPDARTVRKVTPGGVVTTVVGRPGSSGNLLGALPASLGRVESVAVLGSGQVAITADDGVFIATFP